jgi:phosphate-selective porin
VVWRVSQPLRVWTGADWLAEHAFELGFRYDGMTTEVDESGSPAWQRDYAFGLAYLWRDFVKVQIDYVLRRTEDRAAPDLDDDGLTMCLQGAL